MTEVLDDEARPALPRPETPEEAYFQQAVSSMLDREPERRWSDMSQVVVAFRRLADLVRRPLHAARDGGDITVMGVRLSTRTGDIAKATSAGIVCSSNSSFTMNVGVAQALVYAGGQAIEAEAKSHGDQPLGACISTGAGTLGCRRVLHAVAAWSEVSCVARAAQRALLMAEAESLATLSVPAIGTGAAKVSLESSAASLATALELHLRLGGSKLTHLDFVLWDEDKRRAFAEVLESVFLGASHGHDVGLVDSGALSTEASTVVRRDR
jgi:serine/threonine-protein kinase